VTAPNGETPAARKARAASRGGWRMSGNAATDPRHMELMSGRIRNRSRCGCGCGGKANHTGFANGVALTSGCEWSMRVWVRDGYPEQDGGSK
jgi:hypothetical protein